MYAMPNLSLQGLLPPLPEVWLRSLPRHRLWRLHYALSADVVHFCKPDRCRICSVPHCA